MNRKVKGRGVPFIALISTYRIAEQEPLEKKELLAVRAIRAF